MSDVDPLIRREMQWMALGVLENRDLAPIIIAKVRRQRIRRAIISGVAVLIIAFVSIGLFEGFKAVTRDSVVIDIASDSLGENAATQQVIQGLISDYPITWEQSVGDVGAILQRQCAVIAARQNDFDVGHLGVQLLIHKVGQLQGDVLFSYS